MSPVTMLRVDVVLGASRADATIGEERAPERCLETWLDASRLHMGGAPWDLPDDGSEHADAEGPRPFTPSGWGRRHARVRVKLDDRPGALLTRAAYFLGAALYHDPGERRRRLIREGIALALAALGLEGAP
jgi:hypothetical protein